MADYLNGTMKKLTLFLFSLLLLAGIAYGAGRMYNAWTDGFSLGNITYSKPYNPKWEFPPLSQEDRLALSQPYRYLGKGHQSYVFESADGEYVIKFLKCHLVDIKPWFAWLPLPEALEPWRHSRRDAKKRRLEGILTGWKIALERLQAESGVVAIRVNSSTKTNIRLNVKNKAGWDYEVDLDKTAFLLQRKVDMFLPTLERYVSSGETEQAKKFLLSLLELYKYMNINGISDADPQVIRNTGAVDGRPVLIDVGRLKTDPKVLEPMASREEIVGKTRLLLKWLQSHHPDLALFFEQHLVS